MPEEFRPRIDPHSHNLLLPLFHLPYHLDDRDDGMRGRGDSDFEVADIFSLSGNEAESLRTFHIGDRFPYFTAFPVFCKILEQLAERIVFYHFRNPEFPGSRGVERVRFRHHSSVASKHTGRYLREGSSETVPNDGYRIFGFQVLLYKFRKRSRLGLGKFAEEDGKVGKQVFDIRKLGSGDSEGLFAISLEKRALESASVVVIFFRIMSDNVHRSFLLERF